MKFILYIASSLNWYIAKDNNETPWSEEEWSLFSQKIKEIWCIIIWRKTYDIMKNNDEFNNIWNPLIIIFSSKSHDLCESENFKFVSSLDEMLEYLSIKNINNAIISGWKTINTLFLQNNLIDEIFIDIESFIFWKWIKIFDEFNINDKKLELIEANKISKNLVQLHYNLTKN